MCVLCRHAYQVAGLVVAKCPRLTYSRTDSRCLLPRLVDWLALPLLSSHKPQPQGTAPALQSHLHLVRRGLGLGLNECACTYV